MAVQIPLDRVDAYSRLRPHFQDHILQMNSLGDVLIAVSKYWEDIPAGNGRLHRETYCTCSLEFPTTNCGMKLKAPASIALDGNDQSMVCMWGRPSNPQFSRCILKSIPGYVHGSHVILPLVVAKLQICERSTSSRYLDQEQVIKAVRETSAILRYAWVSPDSQRTSDHGMGQLTLGCSRSWASQWKIQKKNFFTSICEFLPKSAETCTENSDINSHNPS